MRFTKWLVVPIALTCLMAQVQAERPGPRQVLEDYLSALKSKDYAEAERVGGIHPPAAQKEKFFKYFTEAASSQSDFQFYLSDFKISQESIDGGLASFTVEETDERYLSPLSRKSLSPALATLADHMQWGTVNFTDRYLLLNLDGRWTLDTFRVGLRSSQISPDEWMLLYGQGDEKTPQTLAALASLLNGVSLGRALASCEEKTSTPIMLGSLEELIAKGGPQFWASKPEPASCVKNLKNIGTALEMSATDNKGYYPRSLSLLTPNYLKAIPQCPEAASDTYSGSYRFAHKPQDAYTLFCSGHSHSDRPANYPQYNSNAGLVEK